MKKSLTIAAAVLCAVFALSSCSKAAAKKNFILATGGTSGTYYPFGGAIANIWNTKIDNMNVTAQATGASAENLRLISKGEAEFAIVQNDVMSYAYTATDLFSGEDPITNFSAVCSCYPEYVQILSNTDITSIEQLAGKNVSVGDAGSGTEFNAKQILAAYGLSFDDINVSNQSFADSADSLKNGTIDAAFVVAGYPPTAVTELSTSYNFKSMD